MTDCQLQLEHLSMIRGADILQRERERDEMNALTCFTQTLLSL